MTAFARLLVGTVARYRATVADGTDDLALLLERMAAGDALDDRRTVPGHVTTSAVIVDPAVSQTLFIHHRAAGRWFQPGGHWEPAPRFVDSARREAEEETGAAGLGLHPWHGTVEDPLPIDIDSHDIPARPARGEPAHVHFDMRFVFVLEPGAVLSAQDAEVSGLAWRPIADLARVCPRVHARLRSRW